MNSRVDLLLEHAQLTGRERDDLELWVEQDYESPTCEEWEEEDADGVYEERIEIIIQNHISEILELEKRS